jgi:DNA-binding FadR family transcriptional regulator
MRFHQAMARAANNKLMSGVMETLTHLLYHKRLATVFHPHNVESAIDGHERILGAIRLGDGRLAKEMLASHLQDTMQGWEETRYVTGPLETLPEHQDGPDGPDPVTD